MPSPDVRQYIDLTLLDKDAEDIYSAALQDLQTRLPDWVPRSGNTEVMLLQSLSLEVAESVLALNRLPGAIVIVLLRLYGIDRNEGTPPIVTLQFTVADTAGHTIPAGTRAQMVLDSGLDPVNFATDTDLVIAPGNSVGTVSATGDRFTTDANGVASGDVLPLIDAVSYVDSVITTTTVGSGSGPEDDATYFSRAMTRLAALTDTLVLPSHFVDYALTFATVYRAFGIDLFNPPSDFSAPGHMTIAVLGQGGVTLSSGEKSDIQVGATAQAASMLAVHVIDPTITTVNVTADIAVLNGFDDTTVHDAVVAALTNYLSTDTWPWNGTVRVNKIIQTIEDVPGVDYCTLSVPASDVTLTQPAPLASAGTISITVL